MPIETQRLPRTFFARDTSVVARELLGQVLVRLMDDGKRLSGRIVEVEAYRQNDAASHSFRGLTPRTAPMFGQAGVLYVYLIYGMHCCANVVTEAEGSGAAVLLRALEPIGDPEGIERMHVNYGRPIATRDLCRGPGRLCKALQINCTDSGRDLLQPDSPIFVTAGSPVVDEDVAVSARIGIGGDDEAKRLLWRWYVKDSPFVSRPTRLPPPASAALSASV